MSELIQKFDGQTLEEWIEWYNKEQPNAVEAVTEKIYNQFEKLKAAVMLIDKDLIREWVKDLVYTKTFCGLKVQQAIISFIAGKLGKTCKLANKKEEGKGIDGYIGETAVQIKSVTYKMERYLNEVIDVVFIYYEKKKDGLNIEYNESQIL